jgi:predicted unusual protein kinase regulating ubiquinone biosynthesis (AarF/ABC1/UbiB family)/uncharacterized protein YbbC (DUF1343 family)
VRLLAVLGRLLPLLASFLRDRRRWLVVGAPLGRTAEFHRRRAERLVAQIAELGPSYVKLAQVFSARADLIPEPYLGVLSTLTDQVPPVPTVLIQDELERAWGQRLDEILEGFDAEPLAAASLGQVHRGCFRGRQVAIKVLRPGVAELVRRDLAVALPLLRWLERLFPNAHLRSARAVVEEFASRIWEEMDFVHEADNADEMRLYFRHDRRVVVPRVFHELTRRNVLVLEYVEGTRIDRLKRGDGSPDPKQLLQLVVEIYLRMMLVHGFFHADPHPGNLLVSSDGRLVLLDFGMVVRVPVELRRRLIATVFAAIRRDVDGVVAGFASLGMLAPGADLGQVRALTERLMAIAYQHASLQEKAQLIAHEVLAMLYDWPVELPSALVYFARTAALIEGLGVRYDSHFNPLSFAAPIAMRMRGEVMYSLGENGDFGWLGAARLSTAMELVLGTAHKLLRLGKRLWQNIGLSVLTLVSVPLLPYFTADGVAQERVRLGIEVLLSDSIHLVRGKRLGLITNHSGVLPDGRSSIDVLFRHPEVQLVALFAPEHGLRGLAAAGEQIPSGLDSATGLPVYSLYGDRRAPSDSMLRDIELLLYDIQDVGARVYTFPWTMALAAEAAGRRGIPFVVLDRPVPVRGDIVEGGVLDTAFRSFVGLYPVALRYGLTAAELLRYLVGSGQLRAQLSVVPMANWRRSMWWDETGLPWRNPSPNIRSLEAALLYSGTVFFEGTNLSEGRGTEKPFQQVGAPWLADAGAIARELNAKGLAGVHFDSVLVPVEPGQKWGGLRIPMIRIQVRERDRVQPYRVGLELLRAIYVRHPGEFEWRTSHIDRLAGSDRLRQAVERPGGIEELIPVLEHESRAFRAAVAPYLLYR